MRRTLLLLLLLALGLLAAGPAAAQGADDEALLERALAAEARQVALIERLAPSVAAVFPAGGVGQGGGSGVVIDPAGYVLTNFHVSGLNARLQVGLNDGRIYDARLLGIDPGGDIALLRLEGRKAFQAVPLGESDAVRPGERVYAMGNPFLLAEDFAPTVTQGIVSGVHRYRDASGSSDLVYGDCIQIDASINPGNSGGPLFSSRGTLLGINGLGGFRPDRGRVNVGVGFAASIDQIENFLLDLRACRQCIHGTMNATVRDFEEEDGTSHLVVDAISRQSNAYAAGLRLGDRVTAFDGTAVETQNRLLTLVSRLPSGRRITLSAERDREDGQGVYEMELSFRLEPLWSGPARGEWKPDPDLVASETDLILAAHRKTSPPLEWVREESVTLASGETERRVTRLEGDKIRVERGPPGSETVDVYDGSRGWRRHPDGTTEQLAPAVRDDLAGTAEALHGLSAEAGEKELSSLTFTGGEWLAGRHVLELEARDRAGRERLLYLDPETKLLVGLAYPDPEGGWGVEESWRRGADGRLEVVRVGYDFGEPIETARCRIRHEPQDAALFERGE